MNRIRSYRWFVAILFALTFTLFYGHTLAFGTTILTNKDGRSIEVNILGISENEVSVRMNDGREFNILFETLIDENVAKLKESHLEESDASSDLIDGIKKLNEFKECANYGDARCQFYLGVIYDEGEIGVPEDNTEAVKWYRKAAEQGYLVAQLALGVIYDYGEVGIPEDNTEAVKWYRKAAEQGDLGAQLALALTYDEGEIGVSEDNKEAVKWYRKAAEQGSAQAQYNLGLMHYDGEGVRSDNTEAFKWYSKAAEQGLAEAQYNLGLMYYTGEGLRQDYVMTHMWFSLAAEQELEIAQKSKAIITKKMTKEQIAEAQKLSREWMAKHSEKNK